MKHIKQADVQGSELGAFAPSEAESVPSVARNIKRDRSRDAKLQNLESAKSAEGTKTDVAGGGHYLSAKRADFRLAPYGLLARDKKLKNFVSRRRLLGYRSQMSKAHLAH